MASISFDAKRNCRILFVAPDGSRKTLRPGKLDKKSAESISRHVEALLAANITGQPLERTTATWLTTIGDTLRDKLAAVGLIEAKSAELTIADALANYLERGDVKGSTKTVRETWGERLKEAFGNRPLSSVQRQEAEAFRDALIRRGLAAPTVGRMIRFARQLFTIAKQQGAISSNPFDSLAHNFREGPGQSRDYADPADVNRLLESCPPAWRVLVGLARFGGLRCPSEGLLLRWQDVNLPERRMTVTSPKTEHAGKGWRFVPITPDLAAILEDAWELSEGQEFVVDLPQYRSRQANWVGCNIRTQLARLIKRAGVPAWSRPFRVFRSSCVTDWARHHPIHAVAAWAGHTVPVAGKHYLTVTDSDFHRATGLDAAQNPAQQIAAKRRTESQSSENANSEIVGGADTCDELRNDASVQNYPAWIRTPLENAGELHISAERGTESGTLTATDPELSALIAAWPTLPGHIKAAIRALVGTNNEGGKR